MNIKHFIDKQRNYFATGETRNVNFRIKQLQLLKKIIIDNEKRIIEALEKDLCKSPFETYATEIAMLLEEIKFTTKRLTKWVRPENVPTPITHFLSRSHIYSEPYGIALVIAPWNYPFQLAIAPLIGAIAAGNCVIIKPSEYSIHTSNLLNELISNNFNDSFVKVILGGKESNQELLKEKFDYIFFTGSVPVGQIVMEAAAKHLTPVTLELGGKSPSIVYKDADLNLAAKRITWGKYLNAGQTCVAPDYLIVHKEVKEELLEKIKYWVEVFYGINPKESADYPRIINEIHIDRLRNLLDKCRIIIGGEIDRETKYVAPTIIDGSSWMDSIMQGEIFGPILPVIEFEDIEEVIKVVNSKPKPLALYLFTNNGEIERKIVHNISFGGGCINDTIMHLASPHLPFGGVGTSGTGAYHGKASFDTFSHKKSILKSSKIFDLALKYPPYGNKIGLLRRLIK